MREHEKPKLSKEDSTIDPKEGDRRQHQYSKRYLHSERYDPRPSRRDASLSSNSASNSSNVNNEGMHPFQMDYQQRPWLIPYPNLPIAWHNNDHSRRSLPGQQSYQDQSIQQQHPEQHDVILNRTDSFGGNGRGRTASVGGLEAIPTTSVYEDHRRQIREQNLEQGNESDPSDYVRAGTPFGPPTSLYLGGPGLLGESSTSVAGAAKGYQLQDLSDPANTYGAYLAPQTNTNSLRSHSLSITSNPWDATLMPPPSSARSHQHSYQQQQHEVVPYSQEWRVILRSPPRGRTVLYNPQMQSLVVQTTVGRESMHTPMSLRVNGRGVCALCRRPLDDSTSIGQDSGTSGAAFMDTNYFRVLADANIALSRRTSLRGNDEETPQQSRSASPPLGSPTSSCRESVDYMSSQGLEDLGATATTDTCHDNNQHPKKGSSHLSSDALNQGYYARFFVEQVKLGKGFRGSVFLCQHILDGVHLGEYAVKKVAIGDNHDWLVKMLQEVHLLERLHHPNIVSYKHAWLENHQLTSYVPVVPCLFILMECCNGGNLEEYIEVGENATSATSPVEGESTGLPTTPTAAPLSAKERILMERRQRLLQKQQQQQQQQQQQATDNTSAETPSSVTESMSSPPATMSTTYGSLPVDPPTVRYLPIAEIWSFFFDICEGLAHLHRLGIIHRDIKPPNLLLSYSNGTIKGEQGERPRILISDFGECEILDHAGERDRTGATGTLEFLAPELLMVDEQGKYTDEFSFKGDMWSLGMILYYLCYSKLPYKQIDDVEVLKEEIRGFRSISLPPDGPTGRVIPEELKVLIRMLLSTDKSKRPSCDEILSKLAPQRERTLRGGGGVSTNNMKTTGTSATANQGKNQGPLENSEGDVMMEVDSNLDLNLDLEDMVTMASTADGASTGPLLPLVGNNRSNQSLGGVFPYNRSQHLLLPNYIPLSSSTTSMVSRQPLGVHRRKSTPHRRQSSSGTTIQVPISSMIHRDQGVGSIAGVSTSVPPTAPAHRKRVKPLGLGLRHMLNRRMMMHSPRVAPSSAEQYYRPYQNQASQQQQPQRFQPGSTGVGITPNNSSSGMNLVIRSPRPPGQHHFDFQTRQEIRAKVEAAASKASVLGTTEPIVNPALIQVRDPKARFPRAGEADEDDDDEDDDEEENESKESDRDGGGEEVSGLNTNLGADSLRHQSEDDEIDGMRKDTEMLSTRSRTGSLSSSSSLFGPTASKASKGRKVRYAGYEKGKASGKRSGATLVTAQQRDNVAKDNADIFSSDDENGYDIGQGAGSNARSLKISSRIGSEGARHSQSGPSSTSRQAANNDGTVLIRPHNLAISSVNSSNSLAINRRMGRKLRHANGENIDDADKENPDDIRNRHEMIVTLTLFTSVLIRLFATRLICPTSLVRPMVLYPVLIFTVAWERHLWGSLLQAKVERKRKRMAKRHTHQHLEEKTRLLLRDVGAESGASQSSNRYHRHGSQGERGTRLVMTRSRAGSSDDAQDSDNVSQEGSRRRRFFQRRRELGSPRERGHVGRLDSESEDSFTAGTTANASTANIVQTPSTSGPELPDRIEVMIPMLFAVGILVQVIYVQLVYAFSSSGICML